MTIEVPQAERQAVLALPAGSIVLVVSHSPTVLPFASVFLRSLRGRRDRGGDEAPRVATREWKRLVKAADLVVADALSLETVNRAGPRRLREVRVVSRKALDAPEGLADGGGPSGRSVPAAQRRPGQALRQVRQHVGHHRDAGRAPGHVRRVQPVQRVRRRVVQQEVPRAVDVEREAKGPFARDQWPDVRAAAVVAATSAASMGVEQARRRSSRPRGPQSLPVKPKPSGLKTPESDLHRGHVQLSSWCAVAIGEPALAARSPRS